MKKENTTLLSIIMTVCHCEASPAQCRDSALPPLPRDWELIVADGGSKAAARNKGLSLAHGEYVTFLDSDDRITDLFLQQGGELLRKAAGLTIFGIEDTSLSGEGESPAVWSRVYHRVSAFADDVIRKGALAFDSGCSHFYQRHLIEAAGLRFDETVAFGEDRLFNYRYLTLLAEEADNADSPGQSPEIAVLISGIPMLFPLPKDSTATSDPQAPHSFRLANRLHEAGMQCFFSLSKEVTGEEKLDFEASSISREIEHAIDRFGAHPGEREENLPEINQLLFGGPYDDHAKIDALVILGSNNCGYKADAAFRIGKENPGMKYIVSGANLHSSGTRSEAAYLSDCLQKYGVPPSDIYAENRARYTKQNLAFSAEILHGLLAKGELQGSAGMGDGASEERKPRVGILTGGFHIPRARLIAEEMDTLTDFALFWFPAYGPVTRKDSWFESRAGRTIVLGELKKTLKLRKESPALQEQTNEHPKR